MGLPGAGVSVDGVTLIGGVDGVFAGALCLAGVFAFSSTVVAPPLVPIVLVARIESAKDVTIKTTADIVVALESSVAEPRGPNAVWEPIPPKAPARSAAFPLCNNTTMIKKIQTSM